MTATVKKPTVKKTPASKMPSTPRVTVIEKLIDVFAVRIRTNNTACLPDRVEKFKHLNIGMRDLISLFNNSAMILISIELDEGLLDVETVEERNSLAEKLDILRTLHLDKIKGHEWVGFIPPPEVIRRTFNSSPDKQNSEPKEDYIPNITGSDFEINNDNVVVNRVSRVEESLKKAVEAINGNAALQETAARTIVDISNNILTISKELIIFRNRITSLDKEMGVFLNMVTEVKSKIKKLKKGKKKSGKK